MERGEKSGERGGESIEGWGKWRGVRKVEKGVRKV